MRLIWFQRPDGLWNADCTCGAGCCGIRFDERAACEEQHFQRAAKDRENGHKYPPCGPKFPDSNVNMSGSLLFP